MSNSFRTWLAAKLAPKPAATRSGSWERAFNSATEGLLSSAGSATLSRPYAQSTWVHRAVRYVSGPLELVPIEWSKDARGGDVPIDDAELTSFWERPALTRGGTLAKADFIRALVGWLLLKGEFFLILDDTWLGRGRKKSPVIVARPDEMREVLDGARQLVGWVFTDAAGRKSTLLPAQVIHRKQWNPYNDLRGLGDWEAAIIAAKADYAAAVFAKNLSENNGDRGPYVIGKDGNASDEQVKQITAMLQQKRILSRQGDFRPVFLTGDIEVKEPGLQAVDAAYVAQRLSNATEIFLAFGVPPSFATITSSYSIGSASDRFKLIEETCMPLAAMIADALEEVEFLRSGQRCFACFDFDEHSVMQQVRGERVESATKLVDRGVPWRQASEYLRLKLPRFEGDEVGRIPFNLTEIGGELEAEPEEAAPEEDPFADMKAAFKARSSAPKNKAAHPAWVRLRRHREPWEKRMKSKVSRYLMDARAETLRNLAAATQGKAPLARMDSLDILFDLGEWLAQWVKGLSSISRNAMEAAGFECWTEELGKDDPLTLPAPDIDLALARRENRLANAGEKVWRDVKLAIETAINEGRTNEQLAADIKAAFAGIDDRRARAIAATEITSAYEVARDMTFRAAGVEWRQWLHSGLDDNARPTHQHAHLQIREMGEPFLIGGVPMLHPGDPAAPADEVINCRCVVIAVPGPADDSIEGNDNLDIPY